MSAEFSECAHIISYSTKNNIWLKFILCKFANMDRLWNQAQFKKNETDFNTEHNAVYVNKPALSAYIFQEHSYMRIMRTITWERNLSGLRAEALNK